MPTTTAASADYHLGKIEGYLLAQNAPPEILAAAQALHAAAIREPSPNLERAHVSIPAAIELPTIEGSNPRAAEAMTHFASSNKPDEAEPVFGCPQGPITEAAVPRMRKPWSPEAREAAAERMKAMRASGVIKGRIKSEAGTEAAVSGKPFIEVPVEKLQTIHDGYAGRRDPGQKLVESDWADIRTMLEKQRRSVSQIASDYDVDFGTMRQFIDRHSWNGKPAPGEAHAPS